MRPRQPQEPGSVKYSPPRATEKDRVQTLYMDAIPPTAPVNPAPNPLPALSLTGPLGGQDRMLLGQKAVASLAE